MLYSSLVHFLVLSPTEIDYRTDQRFVTFSFIFQTCLAVRGWLTVPSKLRGKPSYCCQRQLFTYSVHVVSTIFCLVMITQLVAVTTETEGLLWQVDKGGIAMLWLSYITTKMSRRAKPCSWVFFLGERSSFNRKKRPWMTFRGSLMTRFECFSVFPCVRSDEN